MSDLVEHRTGQLVGLFQADEVRDAGLAQLGACAQTADHDDFVDVLSGAHRKRVRFHSRRAIGPIKPTSSRNAASGAKPAT